MTYDVIIVGAGAAGAVLAARLSEERDRSVLLLEAGPDYRAAEQPKEMASPNPFNILLPAAFQARYMWPTLTARRTTRQEPRIYWRGKGMGGSTAVNGQIAIRGVLDAFDAWAEAGCEGWAGEQVLPYFNRLEDDLDHGEEPYHGQGGPIPVYRAPLDRWGPVDKALREAALDLGHPECHDLNAPDAEGVCAYAINSRDGRRVSTNDAYLEPARGRPNLTIRGEALVDRVLFEGTRATGVRVLFPEGAEEVRGRLVILAAGAVHSPAILLRSGIGPAADLHRLGIPLLRDLPVGRNFFDHPSSRIELKLKGDLRPRDPETRHTNCCVKYSSGLPGAQRADMLLISMNHGGIGVSQDMAQFGEAGIHCLLLDARSRGTLRLVSADPTAQPEIDIRMMSDPLDLARMRDGARRLIAIGTHPAVAERCDAVQLGNTGRPLREVVVAPDEVIDEWLLTDTSDAQHSAGSCRMGAYDFDDGASVVDPDCRVRGIEALRVIDASIMPFDCKANTSFTTIMIGERMAERLRAGAPAGAREMMPAA